MNVDNENIEPVADLSLALSYSNHLIQRRLNNDTGAGANAVSRIHVTCVAPDPLSELVWSPQKGPSLKCADCSFGNKKPSFLWGAGPSSLVLSQVLPSITAGRSSNEKLIDEDNKITFQTAFPMNYNVTGRDTLARSPRNDASVMPVSEPSHEHKKVENKFFAGASGYIEEMNTVTGLSVRHINRNDDLTDYEGEDICGPNNIQVAEVAEAREDNFLNLLDDREPDVAQVEPSSQNSIGGGGDVCCGIQTSKMEFVLASDVHTKNECKAYDAPVKSRTSPAIRHGESASSSEKENENMMKETDSPNVPLMGKVESTSENLIGENSYSAASKILVSESAHDGKRSCHQEEEMHPEKAVPGNHSPTNSRIQRCRRKGKEKALSDGYLNGRMSREDSDSHESVESCNSTGLFSTGKKRWNFEQQLIVESKRVKKQIQETPGSTLYMKQDSSFMNWISNMMKGFLKSKEDEATALTLTLANPNHGLESPNQDFVTCSKNQDPGCKSMGFQSIFQSIYCPKKRVQEETTLNDNYQTEVELPNKVFDINATLVGCHEENVNCKQFLISNEKHNESTSGNGVGLAMQPKISSVNIAASQENNKTDSMENKNSCNLATGMEKEGTSCFPSLGKRKLNSAENICYEPSSEKKASQNFGYRKDHLGSFWVTRFAPKTSGSSLNLDHHNVSTGGALDCSTGCMKFVPCLQNHVSSPNSLKIVETWHHCTDDPLIVMDKGLEKCATEAEASVGFNRMKGHNDLMPIYKINPISPSPRFRNAEAVASLFVRRLDALKHIMPSDATENTGSATITCLFCGRKGHHLRNCSEITDAELEDLLWNINTYNGTEGSPCFCIRCFQLNHWAVACPNASSKGPHQTEHGVSLAKDCNPSRMQHNSRIEENPKLSDGKENQFQASGLRTVCNVNDSGIGTNLKLNWTSNEMKAADKMRANENSINKYVVSSSGENKSKESQIAPLCTSVSRQILDIPKGIFDAVKMLCLSRTNILKWTNSKMSLSLLEGFFLRLRLGKWEGGLGGTGYYVACITGAQRQTSPLNSTNSISVNVGGIKCLVDSQYISNHDFLEDELTAWWSAATKSGSKLPSKEDLRLKLEERKMLGF